MLAGRFRELADRAYRQNIYTYTDFLSVADQSVLLDMQAELSYMPFRFSGGVEGTERMMAGFGSAQLFGYEEPFPIACIRISPLQVKFAEALSHRDYLGALMHLGIERDVLGDIMIREAQAYVFCTSGMAAHIAASVTRIRHTSVQCTLLEEMPAFLAPRYTEHQDTVVSRRADVVAAMVFHLSRSQINTLFVSQRVSVNGRITANHSYVLRDGDTVAVRGYGKFRFERELGHTKKDKLLIAYSVPE